MKKNLLFISLLILSVQFVKAQTEDQPVNISFHFGTASMSSTFQGNIGLVNPGVTITGIEKPSYAIYLDYALGKVVSIGGTFSSNKTSVIVNKGLANEVTWDGKAYGVGGRLLFHLMGKNTGKFDPYLGAGAHMVVWGVERTPEDVFASSYVTKLNMMVPITAGCRYYFADVFGVGAEFSTGRISRLSLGLNIRL